jgi:lipopolysaccharide transport system ATP-binding protein
MGVPAIVAEGLGKEYRLGTFVHQRYGLLSESLMRAPRRLLGRDADRPRAGTFWALRDVSFEVAEGDAVGIIGANGAGKSTLLKILSRITTPTAGRAELRGRVGALLEVGTGFHQELTGRENVYLNGAILGMSRAEVRRKFDEIVDFAEVEQFLDTPVKRYSSGMAVRLAFAVAAHLEPEILVIDEVLAVGDAAFQRKCLGKMESVAREGRTVLFVSHNAAAVEALCDWALQLDRGRVVRTGPTREVVRAYLDESVGQSLLELDERVDRSGNGRIRVHSIAFRDVAGAPLPALVLGEPAAIELHYSTDDGAPARNVAVGVYLETVFGQRVTTFDSHVAGQELAHAPARGTLVCELERVPLMPGSYQLGFDLYAGGVRADFVAHAGTVEVADGDFFHSGRIPAGAEGIVAVDQRWRVEDAP